MLKLATLLLISITLIVEYYFIKNTQNNYNVLLILWLLYPVLRLMIDFVLIVISYFYDKEVREWIEKKAKINSSVPWKIRVKGIVKWVLINIVFLIIGVCFEYIFIKALV